MSRSWKQHGIIKDKGYGKTVVNRRVRRINRYRLRLGKYPVKDLEVVCGYNICDYKLHHPTSSKPQTADARKEDKTWLKYFTK